MLNVKTWLASTGLSVAEDRFFNSPKLPYIVFQESRQVDGPDDANMLARRKITIELYSLRVDETSEMAIESLLDSQAFSYQKERFWIDGESFFQTSYDFSLAERK